MSSFQAVRNPTRKGVQSGHEDSGPQSAGAPRILDTEYLDAALDREPTLGEDGQRPRPGLASDRGDASKPGQVSFGLGDGAPLDPVTRGFMERRLGQDLGSVRVHADAIAATSALRLNAAAYTVGNDVVFARGSYAPYTDEGRRLLAHELAHVVQQSRGGVAPSRGTLESLEVSAREAGELASSQAVGKNSPVKVRGSSLPAIAKQVQIPVLPKMDVTPSEVRMNGVLLFKIESSSTGEGGRLRMDLSSSSDTPGKDILEIIRDSNVTLLLQPGALQSLREQGVELELHDTMVTGRESEGEKPLRIAPPPRTPPPRRVTRQVSPKVAPPQEKKTVTPPPTSKAENLPPPQSRVSEADATGAGGIASANMVKRAESEPETPGTMSVDNRVARLAELIDEFWTGNKEEEEIIKTIESTPLSQAAELVRRLTNDKTKDGKPFLQELDRVVDLGNNLKLHDALSALRIKAMGVEKGSKALQEAPVLPWHDVMGFFETTATFSARSDTGGKVIISYPVTSGILTTTDFGDEPSKLPGDITLGHAYNADQVLIIHDYDRGIFVPVVAQELVGYEHAGVRSFLSHVGTVASFAIPVSAAESVAARVAFVVLERVLPAVFLFIDENRLNLVKWFPKWGSKMIYYSDLAQAGIGIYGMVQFVRSAPKLFSEWRAISKSRAALEGTSASGDAEKLAVALERQTDEIFSEVDKIQAEATAASAAEKGTKEATVKPGLKEEKVPPAPTEQVKTGVTAGFTAPEQELVDAASASNATMLVERSDKLAVYAKNVKELPGFKDVVVHGTPSSFDVLHNGKWVKLNQRELAGWLRSTGYSGEDIRLISCSTGASADSIARDLSNKLGVKVMAPTEKVWVFPDGSMKIGATPHADSGSWVTFRPGKPGSEGALTIPKVSTESAVITPPTTKAEAVSSASPFGRTFGESRQKYGAGKGGLGEGPEVGAISEAGKRAAGMTSKPQHHVLPREERTFFEERGFTGTLDIDEFCVELEQAHHEAIHGGGDWRLARRVWPGEWNTMVMRTLKEKEAEYGRKLTVHQILDEVAALMNRYQIPAKFERWRGAK